MLEKKTKKHDTSDRNNPDDVIHDVHLQAQSTGARYGYRLIWLGGEK